MFLSVRVEFVLYTTGLLKFTLYSLKVMIRIASSRQDLGP